VMWEGAGTPSELRKITAAFTTLGRSGFWREVLGLLALLRRRGLEPDVIICNAALAACSKVGAWSWALHVLRELREMQFSPERIGYNVAINACAKGGQWRQVLRLLEEMRASSIRPGVTAYTSAMSSEGEEPRQAFQRVWRLWDEMQREGLVPDVVVRSTVMGACARGLRWRESLELLQRSRREASRQTTVTCSAAIGACEKGKHWQLALTIVEDMYAHGPAPGHVAYNAAIGSCVGPQQWKQVLGLMRLMESRHYLPDVIVRNAAIRLLAAQWHWRGALDVFVEAQVEGLQGPAEGPVRRAKEQCRGWDELALLRRRGETPELANCIAVLKACETSGLWQRALGVVEDMIQLGPQPDHDAYRVVAQTCGRASQPCRVLAELIW